MEKGGTKLWRTWALVNLSFGELERCKFCRHRVEINECISDTFTKDLFCRIILASLVWPDGKIFAHLGPLKKNCQMAKHIYPSRLKNCQVLKKLRKWFSWSGRIAKSILTENISSNDHGYSKTIWIDCRQTILNLHLEGVCWPYKSRTLVDQVCGTNFDTSKLQEKDLFKCRLYCLRFPTLSSTH